MKNRIDEQNTTKTRKITIELHPEQHADLTRMADILGTTVARATEALLYGIPEDYLGRLDDPIWLQPAGYIHDVYGTSPLLNRLLRVLKEQEKRDKAWIAKMPRKASRNVK